MPTIPLNDVAGERVELLTAEETAKELRIAEQTLAVWRLKNRNLPYVKAGRRVLYRRADIDQFLERQLVPVCG